MAIGASPVQTAATGGGKVATFGSNTTAGNAIIVLVGTDQLDVTNVADDNGNSYVEIVKKHHCLPAVCNLVCCKHHWLKDYCGYDDYCRRCRRQSYNHS